MRHGTRDSDGFQRPCNRERAVANASTRGKRGTCDSDGSQRPAHKTRHPRFCRAVANARHHRARVEYVDLVILMDPRGPAIAKTNAGHHRARVEDVELVILMDARGPAIAKGRVKRWATQSTRGRGGACDSDGPQRPCNREGSRQTLGNTEHAWETWNSRF